MRTGVDKLRRTTGIPNGVAWAAGIALFTAASFCVLLAGPLAVYPGAKLDHEFEQTHLRLPKTDMQRYFTPDSFGRVVASYKRLAPADVQNAIGTKTRRRITFREKPFEESAATVEWSNEAGEDRSKTFLFVDTAR